MTFKIKRFRAVVKVHVHAIFHRQCTAAHDLSWGQGKKLRWKQYSPPLSRRQ